MDRNSFAANLAAKPVSAVVEDDFRYPPGDISDPTESEPANAEQRWSEEHGGDALAAFKQLHRAIWGCLLANLALLIGSVVIRYSNGSGLPSTVAALALLGCTTCIFVLTTVAFWCRGRIMVSVFDNQIWAALEQAKGSADPWRMMRWLGRAFNLIKNNPCWVQRLDIWQAGEGIKSPNSFDYILDQVRQAGVLALSAFPPQGARQNNQTAEGRYNELLDRVLALMPKFKHRWTYRSHLLAWFNLALALGAALLFLQGLMILGIKLIPH
jgi:hypothetical protein